MNKFIKTCVLALALVSSISFAQDSAKMKQKIQKDFPKLNVDKVEFVKSIGLYELEIKNSNTPGYTNENNDFFIIDGQIIDIKGKVNYSKERDFIRVKKLFASLPLDKAIKFKYGNGSRKIVVFSDPDCPFCKQLDKEIHTNMKNDNLTIYYLMNPLDIPGHEQAPLKAAKIFCSGDKNEAWLNWMLKGELPKNKGDCKNPVAEQKEIARLAGYNSTPVIVFDNGYTADRALTADQIRTVLKDRQP